MKVNGVNGGFNPYEVKKVNLKTKKPVTKVGDKIELSNLGKSLNDFSNGFNEVDRIKKVEKIKSHIENGTYKIDVSMLTRKLVECMGVKNYAN